MAHMVVFRSGEGKPGYHQVESLDDAVRFVERLRNQEGIADCRVFRMEEVPLEFKTYVKVEVAAAPVGDPATTKVPPAPKAARANAGSNASASASASASAPAATLDEPVLGDDPVVVEPLVGNGQAAGRFNRFNRT